MDEVGRGTTVQDGLSIAFATVHHLVHVNKCRALFATHFHEIADILGYSNGETYPDVSFFCTDVDETEVGHFSQAYCFQHMNRMDIFLIHIAFVLVSIVTVMA